MSSTRCGRRSCAVRMAQRRKAPELILAPRQPVRRGPAALQDEQHSYRQKLKACFRLLSGGMELQKAEKDTGRGSYRDKSI